MIDITDREGIHILRIAHGKANALTTELCTALTACFRESEPAARAVVLTGQGGIFSAGVDLLRLSAGGASYVRDFLPALSTMISTVFAFPKPVVAAVNGHAIAGGCVLACAADWRVMGRAAGRIGVTELLVGVPFPPIALEVMRFVTAPQHLSEAVYGGATFTPEEGLRRGLIDEVVDDAALLEQALAGVRRLADLSPRVFALTKQQVRRPSRERARVESERIDAEVERMWAGSDTLARVQDYVARTLRKS
jgi:enoyl-CoA hydratase